MYQRQLISIILGSIENWGLRDKVFSVVLDDEFVDDSVASNVESHLQKWNSHCANQSLFVVRYGTHLLDQVIQVGLDELDKIVEKSMNCSESTEGLTSSEVKYANYNYAASGKDWSCARRICDTLEDFHRYMDIMHNFPCPVDLFEKVWQVKCNLQRKVDNPRDDAFATVVKKMQEKFKKCWKLCCLHFYMAMIVDPSYRLENIKLHVDLHTDTDYIRCMDDILLRLFDEYSGKVEDSNCTKETRNEINVSRDDDRLKYYRRYGYPICERPMTELDQYLQEPCLSGGERDVLHWWKEHNLTYPTVARMARDILAMPCRTDCNVAIRTAKFAIFESRKHHIEKLVCLQDWLTTDGSASQKSTNGSTE
ncbi:zinc finger BED domain-containing protein RICESLEEPER 1-like [Oryza glaberrima]|uniref:zinc finger BED domain-containing protein RICESLEEPER 1-like n=1 Tax=Oryza glaberrima TaxID=4538 RepID=UPI00224C385F|nr:zinc finger BED domain-containing protein RICESLEEPER 1-like [Oryza glaberrima]